MDGSVASKAEQMRNLPEDVRNKTIRESNNILDARHFWANAARQRELEDIYRGKS
jgi:hypothetical protein